MCNHNFEVHLSENEVHLTERMNITCTGVQYIKDHCFKYFANDGFLKKKNQVKYEKHNDSVPNWLSM